MTSVICGETLTPDRHAVTVWRDMRWDRTLLMTRGQPEGVPVVAAAPVDEVVSGWLLGVAVVVPAGATVVVTS